MFKVDLVTVEGGGGRPAYEDAPLVRLVNGDGRVLSAQLSASA